jgi:hypothetical protein
MAKRKEPKKRKCEPTGDYPIGYCRPPAHSQWQKGCAPPNRRGRPPNPPVEEDWNSIVEAEAARSVTIIENGKPRKIPAIQALIRGTFASGIKGNSRSQRMAAAWAIEREKEAEKRRFELAKEVLEKKVQWHQEFERCRKLGLELPQPYLHPDDLEVDMLTGEVTWIVTEESRERMGLNLPVGRHKSAWHARDQAKRKLPPDE